MSALYAVLLRELERAVATNANPSASPLRVVRPVASS